MNLKNRSVLATEWWAAAIIALKSMDRLTARTIPVGLSPFIVCFIPRQAGARIRKKRVNFRTVAKYRCITPSDKRSIQKNDDFPKILFIYLWSTRMVFAFPCFWIVSNSSIILYNSRNGIRFCCKCLLRFLYIVMWWIKRKAHQMGFTYLR